jgi:hypothetical protein
VPRRCGCGEPICPRAAGKPLAIADADADGTPLQLRIQYECLCGSHQSCLLWECEDFAEQSFDEALSADRYDELHGADDRAATRPFFSIALELAELGL